MVQPKQVSPTIREYGVFGDQKFAFLKDSTRLDYMEHFIGKWLSARRSRGYAYLAAIVGLFFLFSLPIVSMAAFAFAAYQFIQHKMYAWYTEGDYADHRNLILAD